MFGSNKNVTELVITGDNKSAKKAITDTVNQLDQAERKVQRMSRGWGDAMSAIAGGMNPIYLMGGVALAAAGGFTALIKSSLDLGAELYKMSAKTGLSVETLSALHTIAEQNGISFDQLVKLYQSGSVELTVMTQKLIEAGNVMSTGTAKDAAALKGEMNALMLQFQRLAVEVLPAVVDELSKLVYIRNTITWKKFLFGGDFLEGYDEWKKQLYQTTQSNTQLTGEILRQVEAQKNLNKEKKEFISRIEQQRKAQWGTRETEEKGLMTQPDNFLALQTFQGFYMEMIEQRKAAIIELTDMEVWGAAIQSEAAMTAFGNMADAMNTFYQIGGQKSQAFFLAYKAFAMANALISGREAVMHAYKEGAKWGGPILGGIFAAAASVFVGSQMAAIASTQPGNSSMGGGTGGGSSIPSYQDNRSSMTNNNSLHTTIIIYGYVDENNLRSNLIPKIEQAISDGAGNKKFWGR